MKGLDAGLVAAPGVFAGAITALAQDGGGDAADDIVVTEQRR
ncbi:hypothetical protein [Sphingopyxis indica]|nr:hypothetical protein [Sphingopyxis indica]